HMVTLIDDLLDISRITRGKVELNRTRVDMRDVVSQAIEMSAPLMAALRHDCGTDIADEPLWVDGDPARLAQIVSNLLTNAAKYTPAAGRITVRAEREGDCVVVRVKDNGIGISPEMMPKIFDLFMQEGQSLERDEGGLGLGLAIVQNLVTLHGGTVEAMSPGRDQGE
ncbi:sensor histidine kinase, partial [Bradymonas sediminis]